MFFVEITTRAEKDLNRLPNDIAEDIKRILKKELQENPTSKGKFFGKSERTGLAYWEKVFMRGPGYRAYYTIIKGVVTVEILKIEGTCRVDRITTKKEQEKTKDYLGIK